MMMDRGGVTDARAIKYIGVDGGADAEPASSRPAGFVAARVATPASTSSVRIELNAGAAAVELHWPLAHARELAVLLRELGR